jgi:hypothetical protein
MAGWCRSRPGTSPAVTSRYVAVLLVTFLVGPGIPLVAGRHCRRRDCGLAYLRGGDVIVLASARLSTYPPWTSAVYRPAANRGWHGGNFFRNGICRGIRAGLARPTRAGFRTWPGWTTGELLASCDCCRGPASGGRRRAICSSPATGSGPVLRFGAGYGEEKMMNRTWAWRRAWSYVSSVIS